MPTDFKTVSFLLRGKRRRAVLEALEQPRTPKELAEACRISISNVSNALAELVKRGFVACKTPKAHTYKFYALTSKGRSALETLKTFREESK